MSLAGTYATFPDGRRKAGIGPKPDIAGLLSRLGYGAFSLPRCTGAQRADQVAEVDRAVAGDCSLIPIISLAWFAKGHLVPSVTDDCANLPFDPRHCREVLAKQDVNDDRSTNGLNDEFQNRIHEYSPPCFTSGLQVGPRS
jgi:hypothetical protein